MDTEKKNTGFIVLVIVLILMVIGLTSYIVYDKVLSKKEDSTDKIQESSEQNSHVNDENYDDGKALFEKFIAFKSEHCTYPYIILSEYLNYSELSNDIKLEMAMLNSKDIVYNKNFSVNSNNYYSKIKISDLEKSYKDLFGLDKTLYLSTTYKDDELENKNENEIHEEFTLAYWDTFLVDCVKESDEFVCYLYPDPGGDVFDGGVYTQYDYSELVDGKLNVYLNYLHWTPNNTYSIYSDAAEENLIEYIFDEGPKNPDKLFEKYKGKTGVYKLVFAKDTNDNWYWEETQIVRK